jgi:hypothetical protein
VTGDRTNVLIRLKVGLLTTSSLSAVHLFVISFLFFLTRYIFLLTPAGQLGDADQAVMGMMAQKIASLEEFPLIYWENHYAGAPAAYFAAVIFHFWGAGFVQLRVAMMAITLPAFYLFYFIYRRLFGGFVAFIDVLVLIFCPYLVLNYTTGGFAGYGESFLGMALIILLSWKIKEHTDYPTRFTCLSFGIVCGFFTYIQFYVIPVVLAFAVPVLWALGANRIRSMIWLGLGGLIGFSPMIVQNIHSGGGTITRAAAWILLIGRDDIASAPLEIIRNVFLQKGLYLIGWFLNAPLMLGQYIVPAQAGHAAQVAAGLMIMIVFAMYIIFAFIKKKEKTTLVFYHRQFALFLVIFVLFQWLASLHSPRHFIPLFFVIPIALYHLSEWHPWLKKLSMAFILSISVMQVIDWNDEFRAPRFDAAPVAEIMESKGIREFYSSYWTGYPIMFLGGGRLIGSPLLLPFHEPFGDRRPQYTEQVCRSRNATYVFGACEETLKNMFISFLRDQDVTSRKLEMDGTTIYYHFSKPVGVSFKKTTWDNTFFLK